METKICKVCGRELPLTAFANNRYGTLLSTCRECVSEKRAQTRYNRAQMGGKPPPFSDELFDGMTPGDVWRQMCRAEKWLNSREGYKVSLSGEYHQTIIKKLKKE